MTEIRQLTTREKKDEILSTTQVPDEYNTIRNIVTVDAGGGADLGS
jgi:hypothetical protein